jgi:hypothetical protein
MDFGQAPSFLGPVAADNPVRQKLAHALSPTARTELDTSLRLAYGFPQILS